MKKRTVILGISTLASLAIIAKKKSEQPQFALNGNYPQLEKAQHVVFFVKDLNKSQAFYETVFDLQYSATNHPDSSAAMKIVGHTMKFFSFGHYHHDICFVQNLQVTLDEEQWSHYTLQLAQGIKLDEIKKRLKDLSVPYEEGHVLPQLEEVNQSIIHFKDPNGHIIEVLEWRD